MKKTLLSLAFLVCGAAQAATLNPIQLLNPAGSTSGQAIVSTGPSSAPAWGSVSSSAITGTVGVANGGTGKATLTANSVVVGNGTSAVQNIGPGTNGQMFLGVTSGSPYWGNNPAVSGGTVDNSPIGSGTPSSGVFTTLSANGNDSLNYTTTNALSLPSASVVTVTNFTKQWDRVNTNFNASTGVFTVPATGYYLVCWNFLLNSAANVVGSRVLVAVQLNGSTVTGTGSQSYMQSANTFSFGFGSCSVVSATAAQSLTVVITQNSGATRTLDGSASNWISINRLP